VKLERGIAQAAYKEIQKYENLPSSQYLLKPEIQAKIVEEVKRAAVCRVSKGYRA
jgi:type III restriction enzyme